jgi:cytochrome c-type biogenesis protein CcmF
VHAFANDPERGKFILMMIGVAITGALGLFAWRAPKLATGSAFEPISRESALLMNNVLLAGAAAAVFLGTLYPLFLDAATGTKISVGPPYFAATFAPIFVALLLLVPFGPRLAWRRGDWREAMRVLAPGAGVAAIAAIVVFAIGAPHALAAAGAFALAAWVITASALDLRERVKSHALSFHGLASTIAHAGLGISLLGISGTTLWRSEAIEVLSPMQSIAIAGYVLQFDGVVPVDGPNYHAARATIEVRERGKLIATLYPEKRMYPAEGQAVSNTSIRTTGFSDLYVALGDDRGGGRWTVRALVNPLAPFIWLGGFAMAFAGFASLWGRLRLRFARLAPAE